MGRVNMQSVANNRPLPDWPRALRAPLAAAYVGVSVPAFREHIAPTLSVISPTPGTRAWLREDLDAFLDGKVGRVAALVEENSWPT